MATSQENKRVEFTIKWISASGDMTPWEDYVYYCRHIIGTKERAITLAKAFMNKVKKVPELQGKAHQERPNCSYIAVNYVSRERKGKWKHQILSLNLCEMQYADIYEKGKGIVERIPFYL